MDLVLKRLMAYIIDILIVSIVLTPIINWSVINPYIDDYTENYNAYTELIEEANNGDVDVDTEEYKDTVMQLNYNINKYKVISSSISVVGYILYFAVLQWALKGQTIGKKIMKIKTVANKDDKKLNVGNYIIRSVILNNIIFLIISTYSVYLFSVQSYYTLSLIVSYLELLVITIILLMIVLRKDFRGLHDFIAGTKVIDLAPNTSIEETVSVQEVELKEVETPKKSIKEKAESKTKSNKKKKSSSKQKN